MLLRQGLQVPTVTFTAAALQYVSACSGANSAGGIGLAWQRSVSTVCDGAVAPDGTALTPVLARPTSQTGQGFGGRRKRERIREKREVLNRRGELLMTGRRLQCELRQMDSIPRQEKMANFVNDEPIALGNSRRASGIGACRHIRSQCSVNSKMLPSSWNVYGAKRVRRSHASKLILQ